MGDGEIELDERYHAGTYGIPDDATLDAMGLAARTEGMITYRVYEGKSMAGLMTSSAAAKSSPPPQCSTPTSGASPHSTPTAHCSPEPASAGERVSRYSVASGR